MSCAAKMDFSKTSIADWNDEMVQKYHKDGTRFERGFFLKRKMEFGVLKKMLNYASIKKSDRICDVGCGEGFLLKLVGQAKKIVGVEISISALNRSKEILKDRPDIVTVKADAQKIPLPNESFDIVLCCEMLEHLPDPKIVMNEVHRILRHGGKFVLAIPNEKGSQNLLRFARRLKFSRIVEGVSTKGKVTNEWHLQDASKEWLKTICGELFEIKKITNYPIYLPLRIIALAIKK